MSTDARDISRDNERSVPVEREKVRESAERSVTESVERGLRNSLEGSRQDCDQRLNDVLNSDKQNMFLNNELNVSLYNGSQIGVSIDNNLPITKDSTYEEVSDYLSEDKFKAVKEELRDTQKEIDERANDFNSDRLYAVLSPHFREAEQIRYEDDKLQDAVRDYRAASTNEERQEVLDKHPDKQEDIKAWDQKLSKAEAAKDVLVERSNDFIKNIEKNKITYNSPDGRQLEDAREKYASAVADRNTAEKKLELAERKLSSEFKNESQREIADKCVEKEMEKRELNIKNSALANSRKEPISKERQEELSKKADELRSLNKEPTKQDFTERGITNEKEIQYVNNKMEVSRLNEEQKDLKDQFCKNSSMKESTASSLLNNFVRQSKNLEVTKDKVEKIEKREETKQRFNPMEGKIQDRIRELSHARNAEANLSRLNDDKNTINSVLERFPSSKQREEKSPEKVEKERAPKVKVKRISKDVSLKEEKRGFNDITARYDQLGQREKEIVKDYREQRGNTGERDRALYGLKDDEKNKIKEISKELDKQERHLQDRQDFNKSIIAGAERAWEAAKREDEVLKEARSLSQKPKSENQAVNTGALLEESREKTSNKMAELKNAIEKDNARLEKENESLKIDDARKEELSKLSPDARDNIDKLPKDEKQFVLNKIEIEKNNTEISKLSELKDESKNAKTSELRKERINLKSQIKDAKDSNKEIVKELKMSKDRQAELNSLAARTSSVDKLQDSRLSDKEKAYVENKINIRNNERALLKNQFKDSARLENNRQERFNKLTESKSAEERREIEKQSRELLEKQKDFKENKVIAKQEERLKNLSGYVDKNSSTVTDTVSKMLNKNEKNAKELLEKAKLSKEDKDKAAVLYNQMREKENAERENKEISKMLNKFEDIRNQDGRTAEKISEGLRDREAELKDLKENRVKDFSVEEKLYISNVMNSRALENASKGLDKEEKMDVLTKVADMRSVNEYLKEKMSPEQRERAEDALRIMDLKDYSKLSQAKEILDKLPDKDKIRPIDTRETIDEKTKAIDAEIKLINEVLMKDASEDMAKQLGERLKDLQEARENSVARANSPTDEQRLQEIKDSMNSIPEIKELHLSGEELKYLASLPIDSNDSRDLIDFRNALLKDINPVNDSFEKMEVNSIRELSSAKNAVDSKMENDKVVNKAERILNSGSSLTDKQVEELRGSIEAMNMRANNLYRELSAADRSHTDNICKLSNEENRYDPRSQQLLNQEVSSVLYNDKDPAVLQKMEEIRQLREISDRANQEVFSYLRQEYRPSVELIRDDTLVSRAASFTDGRFEPTRAGIKTELDDEKFKAFVKNNDLERDADFKEKLDRVASDDQRYEAKQYDKLLSLHKDYDKSLNEFNKELRSGVHGELVLKEMERDLANYRIQVRESLNQRVAEGKFAAADVDKTVDRLSATYERFQTQTKYFSYANRDDLGRPMNYNISIVRDDKNGGLNAECYSRAAISQTLGKLSLEESKLGIDVTRSNTDLYGSKIDKNIIDKYVASNGEMLVTGNTYLNEQNIAYDVKDSEKSSFFDMSSLINEFKNVFMPSNEREEAKAANTVDINDTRSATKAMSVAQVIVSALWNASSFGRAYERSKAQVEKKMKEQMGIKDDDKDSVDNVLDDVRDEERRDEEAREKAAAAVQNMDKEKQDSLTEKIDRLSRKPKDFLDRIGNKFGVFGRFAQNIGRGISNALSSVREKRENAAIEKSRDKIDRFNMKHRNSEKLSFRERVKYNKLNKELDNNLVSRIKDANEARERYLKEGKSELSERYDKQYNRLVRLLNSREEHIRNAQGSTINSKEFISSYSADLMSSYTGRSYTANYPAGMPA